MNANATRGMKGGREEFPDEQVKVYAQVIAGSLGFHAYFSRRKILIRCIV
jgi:hypothetical protein